MNSNTRHSILSALLANLPHGRPFGLAELAAHRVSPYLASRYVASGWLQRLGQGVYAYPNDRLQLEQCLLFLQQQVPGLHVGAKSALAWQGIRHNVSSRARLELWGERRFRLPKWFTERFPARYFHRALFVGPTLKQSQPDEALVSLPERPPPGLLVSSRERAILEVLSEVGVTLDLEEASALFESLSSLRFELVGALLAACKSIKTVRLFLHLAARTELLDVTALGLQYALPLGSDARWTRRQPDGSVLTLRKPC